VADTGLSTLAIAVWVVQAAVCALWYVSGIGCLIWCIGRRMASLLSGVVTARPVTIIIFIAIAAVPAMFLTIASTISTGHDFNYWLQTLIGRLWLLYPVFAMGNSDGKDMIWAFAGTGALAYGIGLLFYLPWKPVKMAQPRT